ncbi:hypothetical protein TNCT_144391, partial [Trichonephila clavata]
MIFSDSRNMDDRWSFLTPSFFDAIEKD